MGITTRLVTASMSARLLSGFDSVSSTSLANFYIVCSQRLDVLDTRVIYDILRLKVDV